jgi:hypothetical protein
MGIRMGIRKLVLTKYNYALVVVFKAAGDKSWIGVFIKEISYDLTGCY